MIPHVHLTVFGFAQKSDSQPYGSSGDTIDLISIVVVLRTTRLKSHETFARLMHAVCFLNIFVISQDRQFSQKNNIWLFLTRANVTRASNIDTRSVFCVSNHARFLFNYLFESLSSCFVNVKCNFLNVYLWYFRRVVGRNDI